MINCTCRSPPGRTRTHRQATQIMNTPQCSFRFCGIDLSSQSPKVLFYTTKHWTRHSGTGDWPTDLLSWAVSSIRPMVPLHPRQESQFVFMSFIRFITPRVEVVYAGYPGSGCSSGSKTCFWVTGIRLIVGVTSVRKLRAISHDARYRD